MCSFLLTTLVDCICGKITIEAQSALVSSPLCWNGTGDHRSLDVVGSVETRLDEQSHDIRKDDSQRLGYTGGRQGKLSSIDSLKIGTNTHVPVHVNGSPQQAHVKADGQQLGVAVPQVVGRHHGKKRPH